jgi:peptidyl-prolyl cis-trans isomerase A (cyclophilin A)
MKILNFAPSTLICALLLCSGAAVAQSPAPATTTQPANTDAPTAPAVASAPATQQATQQNELPDAPSTIAHDLPPAMPTGPTVVIDTSVGRLTCQLFDKEAPQTVASFVGLATGTKTWTDPVTLMKVNNLPFYDGTTFHRVIPGFMIQGGDRLGTGEGDAGYYVQDEISPTLRFDVPGRLAMANSGPGTDGSQFFITEVPTPQLDGNYTIFGQCDTHTVLMVKSIAMMDRDAKDKPLTAVVIEKITIVPVGQPIPPPPPSPASAPPTTQSSGGEPELRERPH